MRRFVLMSAVLLISGTAVAQIPGLRKYTPADNGRQQQQGQPLLQGIDALRTDFAAQSGGTTVYYAADSAVLTVPSRTVLAAQAAWLRRHPEVSVRVEGYADPGDTRDHGLAVGARRAAQARDFLVLLGVPSAQVSITTWGNVRSGPGRAVTLLVR